MCRWRCSESEFPVSLLNQLRLILNTHKSQLTRKESTIASLFKFSKPKADERWACQTFNGILLVRIHRAQETLITYPFLIHRPPPPPPPPPPLHTDVTIVAIVAHLLWEVCLTVVPLAKRIPISNALAQS